MHTKKPFSKKIFSSKLSQYVYSTILHWNNYFFEFKCGYYELKTYPGVFMIFTPKNFLWHQIIQLRPMCTVIYDVNWTILHLILYPPYWYLLKKAFVRIYYDISNWFLGKKMQLFYISSQLYNYGINTRNLIHFKLPFLMIISFTES